MPTLISTKKYLLLKNMVISSFKSVHELEYEGLIHHSHINKIKRSSLLVFGLLWLNILHLDTCPTKVCASTMVAPEK